MVQGRVNEALPGLETLGISVALTVWLRPKTHRKNRLNYFSWNMAKTITLELLVKDHNNRYRPAARVYSVRTANIGRVCFG